ncbi:MAG: hypothetical protein MPJ50_00200 [Pirellulales bacterium]|nr:hypothetical protein [Pirellulales bacterium]
MKIGLLGIDECVTRLAQAALARGHEIVACWQEPGATHFLPAELASVQIFREWDQLLALTDMDAVIVPTGNGAADDEPPHLAPLRSAVQTGLSALVCHPVAPSTIAHYELDMACEESGGKLIPFTVNRWDPAVAELQQLFGAGPLGSLKQIVIERQVTDDRRQTLSHQFSVDLDLARLMIGDAVRLHAMTTVLPVGDVLSAANNPAKDSHWPNLAIQLVGSTGAAGRWSPQLIASSDHSLLRVQASGEAGLATLSAWPRSASGTKSDELSSSSPSSALATLTWNVEGTTHERSFFDDGQIEQAAIADFEAAVAGQPSAVSWADVCHAMHATESIGRSLKRGRVIDLNYDDYSEEGTFKGLMAAGGCLVLFTALVILLAGVAMGQIGWKRFDKIVPVLLLILLGGFLAMQLLGNVFRSEAESEDAPSSDTDAQSPSKSESSST